MLTKDSIAIIMSKSAASKTLEGLLGVFKKQTPWGVKLPVLSTRPVQTLFRTKLTA